MVAATAHKQITSIRDEIITHSGSKTYPSVFKPEWSQIYPCINKGTTKKHFWCDVCRMEMKCSHQGKSDVSRHVESVKHKLKTWEIDQSQLFNFTAPAKTRISGKGEMKKWLYVYCIRLLRCMLMY